MQLKLAVLCCACAAFWAPAAMAQQHTKAGPADPDTAAPQAPYESAFAGYRNYQDEKSASWREVNDEVGRVGGHAGIFGGAGHAGHGPTMPLTHPPSAASKPQQMPHSMHGKGHQGMMK